MKTIEMTLHNSFPETKSKLVKEGVFSTSDMTENAWNHYHQTMKHIRDFTGHKVKMVASSESVLGNIECVMDGKIVIVQDRPFFLKGNNRKNGYWLDAGLFSGFRATMVPLTIYTI